VRADVLPQDFESMSLDEMVAIGSVITAMPVGNAIPAVVGARPGIVTYADLPAKPPASRASVVLSSRTAREAGR
jgi:hypothetical protein